MNDKISIQQARRYIRDLILSRSGLLPKALEHYEKRFGERFWETKKPVRLMKPVGVDTTPAEDPYKEDFWKIDKNKANITP